MLNKNSGWSFLSGNALKIIAAVLMLIDHIGCILFPNHIIFRIIGRLSFPIFAFMIAEGCCYTKNKLRYFSGIFSLALICQIASYIFDNSLYMGVLVTFSLSIVTVYSLEYFKEKIFSESSSFMEKSTSYAVFILTVCAIYVLNIFLHIDYGFWGCMLPVFASAFRIPQNAPYVSLKNYDRKDVHVFMLAIGLLIISADLGGYQGYSILSLAFISAYSGKRGKFKMKSFFYVFYPLHLAVLQVIAILLK